MRDSNEMREGEKPFGLAFDKTSHKNIVQKSNIVAAFTCCCHGILKLKLARECGGGGVAAS